MMGCLLPLFNGKLDVGAARGVIALDEHLSVRVLGLVNDGLLPILAMHYARHFVVAFAHFEDFTAEVEAGRVWACAHLDVARPL